VKESAAAPTERNIFGGSSGIGRASLSPDDVCHRSFARGTRRRAQAQETTFRSEATEPAPEAAALQELLAEVRTLRQEHSQMREEFSRREEKLRRELRQEAQQALPQLSNPSCFLIAERRGESLMRAGSA